MTAKKIESKCITCQVHCRECFDKDTLVYECDDYKGKVKNDNKRINDKK
jgi:hypothetical protein